MPSIGWGEMLMLALVAIVVVGPKELPRLMRVAGHWMGKARAAAREFQQAFDDLARESEIDEMRRKMDDFRSGSMFSDYEEDEEDEEPSSAQPAVGGNGAQITEADADKRADDDKTSSGEDRESPEGEPEPRTVPSH